MSTIRLNERQRIMLRAIAQQRRTAQSFTHGDAPCSPNTIQTYLDRMVAGGILELQKRSYVITSAGQQLIDDTPPAAPSRIYGNASTKPGSYVSPKWNIRAGAESHKQFGSVGIDA
jgi:hypothetical protein